MILVFWYHFWVNVHMYVLKMYTYLHNCPSMSADGYESMRGWMCVIVDLHIFVCVRLFPYVCACLGFNPKKRNVDMKLVSVGRQEASLRPSLWASWPSPQLPSHCHTEKHMSLEGDINCLGALAGRSLAVLRCTFTTALQMRCRVLVTVPPSRNNWPWGSAL